MANFTDNWSPFGFDAYYRKFELYQMAWQKHNIDMSDFALIAAQSNGGNIAVARDDRKRKNSASAPNPPPASLALTRPAIVIFSASGRLVSQFVWNSGPLLRLGWSSAEELVCVQEDGRILIYDMFGTFIRTFGMGQEAADVRVLDCRVFENGLLTGVAVLTGSKRFFVVSNIAAPAPVLRSTAEIPSGGSQSLPSCWAVVCNDRDVQIILAKDSELYSVDKSGQFQQFNIKLTDPTRGFTAITVSPNQKHMALVTAEGIIVLTSTDSNSQPYCEFDSGSPDHQPKQMAWCGNGAVVGYWPKTEGHVLLMIGPKKDWINYAFDSPVYLVAEMDSLRVISRDSHDMIQKVPSTTMNVMKFGSMAPGAALLEACREYEALSYKADEYLKLVKDNMEDAIGQCIDAAGQEFEVSTQKLLLRAASFGKAFTDSESLTERFVFMCKNLRILNAIRYYIVGMPLTWKQFESISIGQLLDKLVCRRQYEVSYRICGYLQMPSQDGYSKILLHWSLFKMNQRNEPDELVARAIISKLEKTPGISFAECARKARALGRIRLAIDLLERETSAQLQIPLLLEFGKEDLALSKAIASGNADLVYDVILHLRSKMSSADFLMKIRSSKEVFALFIKYCKELNPKSLRDLFFQEDWRTDEGMTFVPEAFYEELTTTERLAALQNAAERFEGAKDEFNRKITEDQIKLIRQQMKLEEKFGKSYRNLTVHQTLASLLQDQYYKLADEFKKDFQISDRHFWFVKIDILAKGGQWEELEKFSKSVRRPPIGYETLALSAFKYRNRTEAQKYLLRVDEDQKLRCLLKMNLFEEAADFAIKQKDALALDTVLEKCRREDNAVATRIMAAKTQLGFA